MLSVCYEKSVPQPVDEYVRVPPDALHRFVKSVFVGLGLSESDAEMASQVIVTADMMGIESHGVQRLKRYYYTPLRKGIVSPRAELTIVKRGDAYAVLDAGNGLGLVVAVKAMEMAIDMASRSGVSMVFVRNSSHFGIAGYYALMAVNRGFIGIALTNTRPLVAYTNTVGRNIGTNAMAIGFPTPKPPPILIDMATSVVPRGRIEVYARLGKRVPLGWGIDERGEVVDDPQTILRNGALLPLGGIGEVLGGHKGSCLAIAIDLLAGLLSGSAWGPYVGSPTGDKPPRVGHLFIAIDVGAIIDRDLYMERIEEFKNYIKSLKKHPKADRVWLPGEKAWLTMETRKRIGIPIHTSTLQELREISIELGIVNEFSELMNVAKPAKEVMC